MLNRCPLIICLLLLFSSAQSLSEEQPVEVLSTIRPLDLLVNELARKKINHHALLNAQQSPHHLHLKPSQRIRLNQANVILWYGLELEPMISNILRSDKNLSNRAISLKPKETDDHDHNHAEHHLNSHYWLDRHYTKDTALEITTLLTNITPELNTQLAELLNLFLAKLDQIDQTRRAELVTLRNKRFLDLHNAWELFAEDFQLTQYQSIGHQSLEFVGAKSMLKLKRELDSGRYDCVIASPESNLRLVNNLLSNSNTTRLLILDPLGNDLPDAAGFIDLLENAIRKMAAC